jgi:DNA-binding response OmpR family regulator
MPDSPCILALDHNRRNLELLAQFLGQAGFKVHPVGSLEDLDGALAEGIEVSLALLDLAGFDSRIWERCDQLRQRGIPFLVISPKPGPALQRAGLSRGAKGVLVKPLSSQALLGMIRMLVKP